MPAGPIRPSGDMILGGAWSETYLKIDDGWDSAGALVLFWTILHNDLIGKITFANTLSRRMIAHNAKLSVTHVRQATQRWEI